MVFIQLKLLIVSAAHNVNTKSICITLLWLFQVLNIIIYYMFIQHQVGEQNIDVAYVERKQSREIIYVSPDKKTTLTKCWLTLGPENAPFINIVNVFSCIVVRGPGAEPGKWVQSFFFNVFMLYRYYSLWNRVMAFSQHWAFWVLQFFANRGTK